jgi:hypothetical protein
MAKPVAVFRSGVIGDSRHTVRLDENSRLVLFPTFSRYITSRDLNCPNSERGVGHLAEANCLEVRSELP